MRTIKLIPLAVALLALSCERIVSPTEVGATVRLTILLRATSSQAIQKATLSFDGREVTTASIRRADFVAERLHRGRSGLDE